MTWHINHAGSWIQTPDAYVKSGGSWRRVQTAYVKNAGVWKQFYVLTVNAPTTTTITSVSPTTVVAPSGTVTISGKVVRTSDSSVVPTGSTMELYNGATKLATTTTNASGNWTFTFTPATAGTYNLTVKFILNGLYLASQANVTAITATTTTTTTIATSPAEATIGTASTFTGSVSSATGQTPTGTVKLQRYNGSAWGDTGETATLASGAFTISHTPAAGTQNTATYSTSYSAPTVAKVDYTQYRVVYNGTSTFTTSTAAGVDVFVQRPALTVGPVITGGAKSHTGGTFTWAPVTDAQEYHIFQGSTYKGKVIAGSALTYTASGLSNDTTYTFLVRARNENQTDSFQSSTITLDTGHPAIQDTGGPVDFAFNAAETNSYRSAGGWGVLGTDLAQGYFSASNGPYYGIARFNYSAMQDTVDAYGGVTRPNRYTHVTCTKIQVYVTRQTGSGVASSVPIGWYMSNTNPGTGTPSVALGPDTSFPSGLATGTTDYLVLPDETWGIKLLNGTYQSIAMYYNGSANYSQYNGGTGFKVKLTLEWDYTYQTLLSPTWS